MQFDFFADEALASIPGLIYQADFLTPEEEKGLLEIIATLPLMPARYKEYESKVRILSFGGFMISICIPSSPVRRLMHVWFRCETASPTG